VRLGGADTGGRVAVGETWSGAVASLGPVLVSLGDHFYAPGQITAPAGTTVDFTNVAAQSQDVTAFDGTLRWPTRGLP
jgi:hypothetical protein